MLARIMQELLQRIDPDYYREVLLLVARTELRQLRQGLSSVTDVKRHSKITRGAPGPADSGIQSLVPSASAQSGSSEIDDTG
jgi:hypothetical protein